MHPNAALVERFYRAFGARDALTMAACYASDVVFEDPVFGVLHGAQVSGMWSMLCERAQDLRIEASGIDADDSHGRARWDAWYTFTQTGRPVHNIIHASFRFRDGRIAEHRDRFDLWRWTRQALGVPGVLLGWSGPLQGKVRAQARANLERYLSAPRA